MMGIGEQFEFEKTGRIDDECHEKYEHKKFALVLTHDKCKEPLVKTHSEGSFSGYIDDYMCPKCRATCTLSVDEDDEQDTYELEYREGDKFTIGFKEVSNG